MSAHRRFDVVSRNTKLTSVANGAVAVHPVSAFAAGQDDVAVHPGARLVDVVV
jgi:hypothetical protein